jgi:CHAT domain-containing protein
MIRTCFVLLIAFISTQVYSQRQFPPLTVNIDSIFDLCSSSKTNDDEKIKLLSQVDVALSGYEKEYPLYRGMVYMYQAFYSPKTIRSSYRSNATNLISNNKQLLADSFYRQCNQLLEYFSSTNRIEEWLPVDKILRSVVSVQPNDNDWCIFTYANKKLNEGHYYVSRSLAEYDLLFSKKMYPSTTDYNIVRVYDQWISLNSQYKDWLAVPYYDRNEKFTLKQQFRDLILHLQGLKDSVITFNLYGSADLKTYQRRIYYNVFKDVVLSYAGWSINDQREGQAILPLQDFLLSDLIPNEMDAAETSNIIPVVSCNDLVDLFSKLCELYLNTGNGKEAAAVAKKGIDLADKYKSFSSDDAFKGMLFLFYQKMKANRAEGKYETALKATNFLKKWWPFPKTAAKDSIEQWNWYIEVRLQEVYTLIAQNKNKAAGDSLTLLTEKLAPLENDSVQLLSKSYQWPQLQFASMQYMARKGKWEIVKNYLLEALTIVEQDNHWENVTYYYDMQLLYFIANYRSSGKVIKHIVSNLLFYTGRQLQYSFFMLTPEDRIRFYEQKLSVYFDVYHELLLNKLLDDAPSIKEQIIGQSLYLKNALVDANLLPNEFLAKTNDAVSLVEDIRASRSISNLLLSRLKMRSAESAELNSGRFQSLWLTLLQNANLDSLTTFTGWKKIASVLDPQQVYVEVIRYNNWLTDSASCYAAYIIKDGELNTVPLFKEKEILTLLKDPSASPQSGSLNNINTRGLTLTKKETSDKKFILGSEDKLGTLVVSPLMPFIKGKKELLIVPDGLLNRISLAALQYKKVSLYAQIKLRQLSGSYVLHQPKKVLPQKGKALLAGGLDYGELKQETNVNRLLNRKYSWQYLPATKKEVEDLQTVLKKSGQQTTLFTGKYFQDTLRSTLSEYSLIHLATHGFYVDSSVAATFYDRTWDKETIQSDAMMRCGIAVSDANFPTSNSIESEGHLMGFELANTDLRKCYLITLSACETGLGDLRNNLGVDGLSRALKLGGAKYLLISLWKVPDAPTAVFMQHFYEELFKSKDPAAALQSTQSFMSRQYNVADWAAFVLVE